MTNIEFHPQNTEIQKNKCGALRKLKIENYLLNRYIQKTEEVKIKLLPFLFL